MDQFLRVADGWPGYYHIGLAGLYHRSVKNEALDVLLRGLRKESINIICAIIFDNQVTLCTSHRRYNFENMDL